MSRREARRYPTTQAQLVVETFFRRLFPDEFEQVLPVRRHQEIDDLLVEWNSASYRLALAQA